MSWSTSTNNVGPPAAALPSGDQPNEQQQLQSHQISHAIAAVSSQKAQQPENEPAVTSWQISTAVAEPLTPPPNQESVLLTQTTPELAHACPRVAELEQDLQQAALAQGSLSKTIKQQSEQLAAAGTEIRGLNATVKFLEEQLEISQQQVALEQEALVIDKAKALHEGDLQQISSVQAELVAARQAECATNRLLETYSRPEHGSVENVYTGLVHCCRQDQHVQIPWGVHHA
jgi:hypothetical protein